MARQTGPRSQERLLLSIVSQPGYVAAALRFRQCPPPLLCDPHPRDLDRLGGGEGALWCRGRKLGAYDADENIEREAVRRQHGVSASFGALGQQFQKAAVIGGHRSLVAYVGADNWPAGIKHDGQRREQKDRRKQHQPDDRDDDVECPLGGSPQRKQCSLFAVAVCRAYFRFKLTNGSRSMTSLGRVAFGYSHGGDLRNLRAYLRATKRVYSSEVEEDLGRHNDRCWSIRAAAPDQIFIGVLINEA